MDLSFAAYGSCELCPRMCGVDRASGAKGVCGMSAQLTVARAALHYWEEPPISGEDGSGAVFFTGCPMKCVFCQNLSISRGRFGAPVEPERLSAIMLELQEQGALNINLVTPSHYAPHVIAAVRAARAEGLELPIVCNTSGYETVETVRALGEVVDVWLTDFKYASATLARDLSGAADYPRVAARALVEMRDLLRARGGRKALPDGDDGMPGALQQGIVVRHLVLPGHVDDSCAVLNCVWDTCGNEVDLSVMNQYTPNARVRAEGGALARAVTEAEYEAVLDHADDLGFDRLWWQQGGTVSESFVPAFDATGVLGPAS